MLTGNFFRSRKEEIFQDPGEPCSASGMSVLRKGDQRKEIGGEGYTYLSTGEFCQLWNVVADFLTESKT